MTALAALVVTAYLGMAAVELPFLWGKRQRKGELRAVITLLVLGLALAVSLTLGYRPASIWRGIDAVFSPIGTPLFRPEEAD